MLFRPSQVQKYHAALGVWLLPGSVPQRLLDMVSDGQQWSVEGHSLLSRTYKLLLCRRDFSPYQSATSQWLPHRGCPVLMELGARWLGVR